MPSPFPGMDPYLEDPLRWEGFHNRFIGALDDLLAPLVRPHFYVEQQSAVYIVDIAGLAHVPPIKTDLYVIRAGGSGATAIAEPAITTPTRVAARYPDEIRQRFLEIRDAASQTVVTVIEVLSPSNKARASRGRRQFSRKRDEVLASPVHWLEIDLLRAGERPAEAAGRSDYYALLKRGTITEEFDIWFFGLSDPLPVIAVPLAPPHPDVALDLHAALATVYDRHYADRLDYTASPPPPALTATETAWAAARVRAWQTGRLSE